MMSNWGNGGNGGYGGGYGWMGMIMPLILGIGIILLGMYLFVLTLRKFIQVDLASRIVD